MSIYLMDNVWFRPLWKHLVIDMGGLKHRSIPFTEQMVDTGMARTWPKYT
jgi:hypothetical protein